MKRYLSSLAAICVLLLSSSIAGAQDNTQARPAPIGHGHAAGKHTIKIGLVASLNGDLSPWGREAANGAKLAVDEINATGGIKGRQIELIVADSGSRPEMAAMAAKKLASDGVVCIVGEIASGLSAQIGNVSNLTGVPQLITGSTRDDLVDISSNMFRICYKDDDQARAMATFAFQHLKKKSIAIVTDQKQPFSTGVSQDFKDEFTKLGGVVVDEEFFNTGDTDFSAQITGLLNHNPDAIYHAGYFPEAGVFAVQLRKLNKRVTLLASDGWDSPEIFNMSDGAIEGSYITNVFGLNEPTPEIAAFTKHYTRMLGNPPMNFASAMTYDAIKLLADAGSRADHLDSQGIAKALGTTKKFSGTTGVVSVDGATGNATRKVAILRATKTKFVYVEKVAPLGEN